MKDFLGNELKVGDQVAVMVTPRYSAELRRAVVSGFTPCFVCYERPWRDRVEVVRVSPEKVMKIKED